MGDWWSDAAHRATEADVRLAWHRELAHAPLANGCCPCSRGFGAVLSVRENGSIKGTQLETGEVVRSRCGCGLRAIAILIPGLEGRVAPQYILGAKDLRKHTWIADHRLCAQTSKACQPEGLQATARLWDEAEPTAIEAFASEAAARPVRLPVPAQTSPYVGVPCRRAS